MGVENNKAAHHIRVSVDATATITHIAWASNHVGRPPRASTKANAGSSSQSWRDLLAGGELDVGTSGTTLDLPRELTFLEVDTALPKISPLPSGSAGDG
jgi:anaphase-promoting complex subunit 4